MLRSGSKQRWMVAAAVALALAAAATATECNVTESDSDSASDSGSTSDSLSDDGSEEAPAHRSCFEVALWCESLQMAVSPDPANDCKYPCPDATN
ncbi:Cellulose synthase 2 [Phytophthora cinnamomi]|uniref:Cellulose synthase 2 n=1 Tax=Phytophthora cinnamomi TaxID=4785 RepID=UPI00355A4019|nr:Cellulose synthase 2 [Phytophthora cinnamomi]